MTRIVIDPITRIEGHLSVEIDAEGGTVRNAHVRGDMFRGFENILKGRNPVDAVQITQRICGVCPASHGIASCRALESAFNVEPSVNGLLIRNLILASNYLQSHLLHFYVLAAPDYIDIAAILTYQGTDETLLRLKAWAAQDLARENKPRHQPAAPFFPRYSGEGIYLQDHDTNITLIAHYVKALDIRMKAHRMLTLLGGRMPHIIGYAPGGVTMQPKRETLEEFSQILSEIEQFVTTCYVPDVLALAKSFPRYLRLGAFNGFLAYGEFPRHDAPAELYFPRGVMTGTALEKLDIGKITEQVRYSRYESASGLHPSIGKTDPQPEKGDAYSWIKSPRYRNTPLEVGPLARLLIGYASGRQDIRAETDKTLALLPATLPSLRSAMGRYVARAIECTLLCRAMHTWLADLRPGGPPRSTYSIPETGQGAGLAEAARGALGHWISVAGGRIENYQCVVPTTWFASPMDDNGTHGPMEQALMGTPVRDEANPIEVVRVVRSFDPCIACAVHCTNAKKPFTMVRK
jgi:ferredoxin hydrogenase large subunit/hydrogenase large subunit